MVEGDVVMVVGNLDDRIRDNSASDIRIGTVVWINKEEVLVLLANGDLWKGPRRDVVLQKDQQ